MPPWGFPVAQEAEIMLMTMIEWLVKNPDTKLSEIRFVDKDPAICKAFNEMILYLYN